MSEVYVLGTRGVPNRYGGFERLVEVLAPYLVERSYKVTVACEGASTSPSEDLWRGVRRIFLKPISGGAVGTISYDFRSFLLPKRGDVALIFGYGTAAFQRVLRMRRVPVAVNMDGIEWRREKWGGVAAAWLRWNERQAVSLSDLLVADHPEIQSYLRTAYGAQSKMIAYGVDLGSQADEGGVGLGDGKPYFLVIARAEPENQIHLILEAYRRSHKTARLLVVGDFESNNYGRSLRARFQEVEFVGPIYSVESLNTLRRNSALYFHGHTVGGTNPSLIEAMASGAVICAHDNIYNRWVLSDGGLYFSSVNDIVNIMDAESDPLRNAVLRSAALAQCQEKFMWPNILASYEELVRDLISRAGAPKRRRARA